LQILTFAAVYDTVAVFAVDSFHDFAAAASEAVDYYSSRL